MELMNLHTPIPAVGAALNGPSEDQTPYWFQLIRYRRLLHTLMTIPDEADKHTYIQQLETTFSNLDQPGIEYVTGDATRPLGPDTEKKIIVHCCNNIGAWGAGFVIALSKRWPNVEQQYRKWFQDGINGFGDSFALGNIQPVWVENRTWVCNLIGQEGVGKTKSGIPPIRYDAIHTGLGALAKWLHGVSGRATIHMPRMGAGLAGGEWDTVAESVTATLVAAGFPVVVYDKI